MEEMGEDDIKEIEQIIDLFPTLIRVTKLIEW